MNDDSFIMGESMGAFTFIPLWVLQDLVILGLSLAALVFILRHEAHPESIILELFAFCFLYASVYENFATLQEWYGYGRSILMVFNVPFTIPLVEYLVVYSTLRLLERVKAPVLARPLVAGLSGMLFDFSLDPVALRQVFATAEGTMGRWTWYPGAADAQIFAEPVYNFTGWILLCGYAAVFILLGRAWQRRSGYRRGVGLAYPFLAMVASLLVLVSPLSRFLLWLWPFMGKGSVAEWIMLGVLGLAGLVSVAASVGASVWGARALAAAARKEWLAVLVLAGLPLLNVAFCLGGRQWEVLWLVTLGAALEAGLAALLLSRSLDRS
jgi:hypothetical protein